MEKHRKAFSYAHLPAPVSDEFVGTKTSDDTYMYMIRYAKHLRFHKWRLCPPFLLVKDFENFRQNNLFLCEK